MLKSVILMSISLMVIELLIANPGMTKEEDKNMMLYLDFNDEEPEDLSQNESPIANFTDPADLVEGIEGKAWLFDESTRINITAAWQDNAFQQSSFSVWLKEPGKDGLIYEEGGGTNGYAVTLVKNEVQFATRNGGTQTTISADYPDDDNWHFIVTIFDRGTMQLYIDGELMEEESGVAGIGGHGNDMGIGAVNGASAGGVTPKFTGIMDEFRITRRAVTEEEIKETFESFFAVKPLEKYHTTWGAIKNY